MTGRDDRRGDRRDDRGRDRTRQGSARPSEGRARRAAPPRTRIQLARRVAFTVIRAVAADDAYANLLLPREIDRAGLTAADAGLATELTYGTLRRQGTYDAILRIAADRETEDIDPGVLDALRLGVHQLLATRVASHAAVNESVELAREAGGPKAGGFANAVLRRVSRDTPGEWGSRIEAAARSEDERLSVRHSHPVWVIRAFRRALAAEGRVDELDELLDADNVSPHVTMAALPGLEEPRDPRTPYSPVGFRLAGGDPEPLMRETEGRVRVQDEGSQLVALALSRLALDRSAGEADASPERWLDLCAGPGGKTALLAAEALARQATLDANEVVPARAGLVRAAISGVPLDVEVAEQDGRDLVAARPETYDRILVDAPCTGLGALRRRPEARWRKRPGDVAELAELQEQLLRDAIGALKPGGVVAYVTCSPHLAETAAVVRRIRDELGAGVEQLDAREALRAVARNDIDLAAPEDGGGHAQLWPHRHGTDAMFLALLRRVG